MNLATLRTTPITDTSNALAHTGERAARLTPMARRALITDLVGAGFQVFRGRQSRYETWSLGAVPADDRAESVTFDSADGSATYHVVVLTDAGRSAA